MKALLLALGLIGTSFALSGCALFVAGAGGYVAGEEISEDDGEFDPFD